MDVFDLQATLSLDTSQYESALARARGAAHGFASSAGGANNAVNKMAQGFTILKGVAANLVSGGINMLTGAISQNLMGAFDRVDTMANYTKVMSNLGFEAGDAEQEIQKLAAGINDLPTSLPAIVRQQQQFTALGMSLKDSTELTLALNNATLAGGQGQMQANRAMAQWYQMIAAGKSDLMSMRIINEAMPAQMDAIAKSVLGANANWQDLHAAWMKDPEITGKVKAALLDLNENGYEVAGKKVKSFAEQAKDANRTIQTALTNIPLNIQKGLQDVIENGIGQDAIIDALYALKDAIKATFGEIKDFIINVKEIGLAKALVQEIQKGREAWANLTSSLDIQGGLRNVFKSISDSAPAVLEELSNFAGEIIGWLWQTLTQAGEEIAVWLIDMTAPLLTATATLLEQYYSAVNEYVDNHMYDMIERILEEIVAQAPNIVLALLKLLVVINMQLVTFPARIIAMIINGMAKAISEFYERCKEWFYNAMVQIVEMDWFQTGVNIIIGIANGIIGSGGKLVSALVGAVRNAYESAKNFLGINSPSKLFRYKIGQGIPEGTALGIKDKESLITQAINDMDEKLVEPYAENDFAAYDEEPESDTETMMSVLNSDTGDRVNAEQARDMTVILQLNDLQLARTVYKLNNEESQRVGIALAGGMA